MEPCEHTPIYNQALSPDSKGNAWLEVCTATEYWQEIPKHTGLLESTPVRIKSELCHMAGPNKTHLAAETV